MFFIPNTLKLCSTFHWSFTLQDRAIPEPAMAVMLEGIPLSRDSATWFWRPSWKIQIIWFGSKTLQRLRHMVLAAILKDKNYLVWFKDSPETTGYRLNWTSTHHAKISLNFPSFADLLLNNFRNNAFLISEIAVLLFHPVITFYDVIVKPKKQFCIQYSTYYNL